MADATRKTFDKIELPEPPTAKRVTRKGKKNVAWNEDPEILKRLASVAELMLEGSYSWEIAQKNRCSIATAKRDVSRVREIWKTQALEKLDNLQADSLATYSRVISKAWRKMEAMPEKADQFLRVIIAAQERVDKMTGIGKPEEVNVTLNGEVSLKDIEEIRRKRWENVAKTLEVAVSVQKGDQ